MATTLNYITEVFIQSAINTNPLLSTLSFSYGSLGDGATILNLPNASLSIGEIIANSIGNVFSSIWDWLLYNLISPLLIIAFIVMFFIMQYYLVRFYYLLVKNIFGKGLVLYNTVIQSEKFKKVIDKYEEVMS